MYKKYFDKKIFIRKAVVTVINFLLALLLLDLLGILACSIYMLIRSTKDECKDIIISIGLNIILTMIIVFYFIKRS